MSTDVWESLSAAVQRRDPGAAIATLAGLDEAARRALAKRASALQREVDREPFHQGRAFERRRTAAEVVAFGTAGPVAAARLWWLDWREGGEQRELLLQRPREWRQEWAERVLEDGDRGERRWAFIHALVRDDVIDPPATDAYVRHAVTGLRQFEVHAKRDLGRSLADLLRGEPHFLEHELWRLLEMEDSGLTARGAWLYGVSQTWTEAIVELAVDGTLDRQRLLDSSLAALRSDWSAYDARWHHQLHEALEPTVEEHVARLPDLLALLASSDAAAVGFTLRALGKLEKAGVLEPSVFLDAVAPALLHPTKSHAVRAIKLTGRVIKRSPGAASLVLPVLVDALAHEAREVQEAALAVLEKHDLPAVDRDRLAELAAHADPAVRGRVAALAGTAPEPVAVVAQAVEVPPLRAVDRLAPRLEGAERLTPVAGVDDLLERAAVAIERGGDPEEMELLLDGVSRLRREPVDPGRRAALLERAGPHATEWQGRIHLFNATSVLAVVLTKWLAPETKGRVRPERDHPVHVIGQRVAELIDDLPGPPRPLLAAPTHRGGWIEAKEAVRRVAALEGRPLDGDLAHIVLRLAPDGRAEACREAQALSGEPARVLALALGADARRPKLMSKLKLAWAAAADARDPDGYAGPDPQEEWWTWEVTEFERWLATVWPANREPVFRIAAARLRPMAGGGVPDDDILDLLLDPAEPVGPHAATALALALGADEAETRTLGADVAIAVLETRRLDGAGLGERLAWVMGSFKETVPARWGPSLESVATAGALHAHEVQAAIERVLAAAGKDDRRRLLPVVELLRRLAAESGRPVADPGARAWLEAISGSSKIARAAREALAVT